MATQDTFLRIAKMLQPTGSAFRIPFASNFEKMYKAIVSDSIGGVGKLYNDVRSIANEQLPDNDNFTIEMARRWYVRLGLFDSGAVTLADMKAAINQKLSFPNTPLNKQHYLFIEEQLRMAGFDVRVYENRFLPGPTTKSVSEVLGVAAANAVLDTFELNEAELDMTWEDAGVSLVMNYIEEEKDADFAILGGSLGYRSTFFIAGASLDLGGFADVPLSRKIEFRQLILNFKAAQMCAILFVNYV